MAEDPADPRGAPNAEFVLIRQCEAALRRRRRAVWARYRR